MSVKNSMQTNSAVEEAIRNRLETGFKNWNGGYEGWLEWCNTLYEPDAFLRTMLIRRKLIVVLMRGYILSNGDLILLMFLDFSPNSS